MSSYGSVWVKINSPETDLLLLQQEYNNHATLPEGLSFACAVQDEAGGEVPEDLLEELSGRFGEAIFMNVQTTVDFFIYSRWRDGEPVRQIQYCADEGWYEVSGEKESWELRLFNNEAEKQQQLGYLDLERLGKNSTSAEYIDALRSAVQIEAVWSGQKLVEKSFYPMATASEIYQIVMQEFGLANPYLK